MGRIDHGRFGDQTGADPECVRESLKRFGLVYFEAEPGDALFFHSNIFEEYADKLEASLNKSDLKLTTKQMHKSCLKIHVKPVNLYHGLTAYLPQRWSNKWIA